MAAGGDFSIKAILKLVDEFTAPVRGIIGTAEQFGKTAKKIGKGFSTYVTAPLAGLAFLSVSTFATIESGMASVSTLIDTTTESISEMTNEVLAISRRTPVAISDLTDGLYNIRSAGISAADSMSVLEGSARLAVAGLGTSAEAVDLVTSSINAFNLQGAEQARIYDIIFKAVKNGKTNISQLAQGFGAVAGTVANAGIQIDEYMASVAAMTTVGLPAAQAHTQIRAALAGLTRETELSSAVFKRLGVKTFKELVQQSGGMVPAFEKISGVLKGNDAAIIKLLGSVEAYNAMLALTRGQNAAYTATLDDMRNGANAVDAAFEKQAKTFGSAMTLFKNQMASVQNVIGAALAPVIVKVAGYLGQFAEWFTALSPQTQNIIVLFGGLAAAIGPVLVGLGFIATAIAALSLPVLLIVGAIALLTAGIGAAIIYWDDIKAAASSALDSVIGRLTKGFDIWNAWRDGSISTFEAIIEYASATYDAIKPIIDAIGWILKYSPAGLVFRGASIVYDAVTGGSNTPPSTPGLAARTAAAQQTGGQQQLNGEMVMRFENAPAGFRVESAETDQPGVAVDTDVGYNMVGVY